jgi:predicted MPP superfamily phosphohydrolase
MSLLGQDPTALGQADLRRRLEARLAVEALHHKGRRAHGRGDYLLRHDRTIAPVLRTVLRMMGLYSRGVRNALNPVVRNVRINFSNLPLGFEGFRLLHLTDFHIDGVDGLAEVLAVRLSDLQADVCVLTGDYRFETEGPCTAVYPRMRTVLSAIRARAGIFGVLGNHDAAEIALELSNCGVRMLVNEALELKCDGESMWLAGVDDPHYYGCDDLKAALGPVPGQAFKILLAHSPEMFQEAAEAGVHLYLCGHTHGGQICLPKWGPVLRNAECPKAYTSGLWRHNGMWGYTSHGVGASMLPVRYNCPPEIALIELGRPKETLLTP